MTTAAYIVLDDRLLVEHLLVGLDGLAGLDGLESRGPEVLTTTYWYFRSCRAAVAGAGGQLSGPFERVDRASQEQAILSLLRLPPDIGLPDPRSTVPAMADIALRHPRLNLLNLEAVAVGLTMDATLWLSEPAAHGVLPAALDAEGVVWRTVTLRQ